MQLAAKIPPTSLPNHEGHGCRYDTIDLQEGNSFSTYNDYVKREREKVEGNDEPSYPSMRAPGELCAVYVPQ